MLHPSMRSFVRSVDKYVSRARILRHFVVPHRSFGILAPTKPPSLNNIANIERTILSDYSSISNQIIAPQPSLSQHGLSQNHINTRHKSLRKTGKVANRILSSVNTITTTTTRTSSLPSSLAHPLLSQSCLLTVSNLLKRRQLSSSIPYTQSRRHYRRRYFRDPNQTFNPESRQQGWGYATRLEQKFKPGSTHIVSALEAPEQHEYRTPILLRHHYKWLRIFRGFTDRPWKVFTLFWLTLIIMYFSWSIRLIVDLATSMRKYATEYQGKANLALAVEHLSLMIQHDLIIFQSEQAKAAFLGVLRGIREEIRQDLDENEILRKINNISEISLVQPLNEMIKPRKQRVFFEYKFLKYYSRMIDNMYNRPVSAEEVQLYRISNQERERKYLRNWAKFRRGMRAKRRKKKWHKRRIKQFWRPTATFLRKRKGGSTRAKRLHKWGPLPDSVNQIPAYYFFGSIVALADAFWLRPNRVDNIPYNGPLFNLSKLYEESSPFLQGISRTLSVSRIRDAHALYRELERYVVQGDYVAIKEERVGDPSDPLFNNIPYLVLQSSDRTVSGPLFNHYSRRVMTQAPHVYDLYRRILFSEYVVLQRIHDMLRQHIYISFGLHMPRANTQRYLKFFDQHYLEKALVDPHHFDLKIGDEGMWDEIMNTARHIQQKTNDEAFEAWVALGRNPSEYYPTTSLTDAIASQAPPRSNKHSSGSLSAISGTRRNGSLPTSSADDIFMDIVRKEQLDKNNDPKKIQLPIHGNPIVDKVNKHKLDTNWQPQAPHLPWPEGFFTDNPPTNDKFYYTRKYGIGSIKDWDRMVRLGAWSDIGREDKYLTAVGYSRIPENWSNQYGASGTKFVSERALRQFEQLDPNSPEMLWLQLVHTRLERMRRHSSFPLLPLPFERTLESKHNHGINNFTFDLEASNDMFTSNSYSPDWLVFSTMPATNPIPVPLHEMNFVSTLLSRVEACIMQHCAEIDFASYRAKYLRYIYAKWDHEGILDPETSQYITPEQIKAIDKLTGRRPEYTPPAEIELDHIKQEYAPGPVQRAQERQRRLYEDAHYHLYRMYRWIESYRAAVRERPHVQVLDQAGNIQRIYVPQKELGLSNRQIQKLYQEYKTRNWAHDPIDRSKTWEDYNMFDADPLNQDLTRSGVLRRDWNTAAMALKQLTTDAKILGPKSIQSHGRIESRLMKERKKAFLEVFGSYNDPLRRDKPSVGPRAIQTTPPGLDGHALREIRLQRAIDAANKVTADTISTHSNRVLQLVKSSIALEPDTQQFSISQHPMYNPERAYMEVSYIPQ